LWGKIESRKFESRFSRSGQRSSISISHIEVFVAFHARLKTGRVMRIISRFTRIFSCHAEKAVNIGGSNRFFSRFFVRKLERRDGDITKGHGELFKSEGFLVVNHKILLVSRGDLRPKGLILGAEFVNLRFEFADFGHGFIVKTLEDLVLVAERREIFGGLRGFDKGFRGLWAAFIKAIAFMTFTLDFLEEMLLASLEKFMGINVVDVLSSFLVEIVHVELTDKRGQIVVFEVGREDFLAEFGRLFDNESCAFRVPVNDIREFSFFENVVCFANERWD